MPALPCRRARRAVAGVVLWLVSGFLPAATLAQEEEDQSHLVLLLSAGAAGDPLHDGIVDGFRERLSAVEGLYLSIEYLDLSMIGERKYRESIEHILDVKYHDRKVDVLVTIEEDALDFALRTRERLFKSAPVVFGGTNRLSLVEALQLHNATGVVGSYDTAANLELMQTLHPELETVVVVDDLSHESRPLREDFLEAQEKFKDRLNFRILADMSLEDVEAELRSLEAGHAVMFLSFRRDPEGEKIDELSSLARLSRASSVPVYGAREHLAGFGIVGGFLQSGSALGDALAQRVLAILGGRAAKSLEVAVGTPHQHVFDYRQLERFGIPLSQLPDDATIIYEPDTFYYRYQHYFWVAVVVFLGLVFYVVQLLISIRKRERARRGLERLVRTSERALTLDNPEALVRDIVGRLTAIAPFLSPVGLYRYAGAGGAFDPALLERVDRAEDRPARASRLDLLGTAISTGESQYSGRSALIVLPDERLPVTIAELHGSRSLDAIDQRLLDISARNISIEFANQESSRLAQSVRTAKAIQEAMLPKDFEDIAPSFGAEVYAMLRAAREVGGDLYDVFALDEDRLCILVGDVADKGIPAALYMSITKTVIRAAAETLSTPEAILEKANAVLERDNRLSMFVTLFLGIYDRRDGRLAYANAGHNPPLLQDGDGNWSRLPVESNIALGVLAGATFAPQSVVLPAGAALLVYSDGVTEAANAAQELYGEDRLQAALAATGDGAASEVVGAIVADVDAFVGSAPQADDMTLLCLRREGR